MFRLHPIRFTFCIILHLYAFIVSTNILATNTYYAPRAIEHIQRPDIRPHQIQGITPYAASTIAWIISSALWYTHGRSRLPIATLTYTSILLGYLYVVTQFLIDIPSLTTCWIYPGPVWYSISNGCGDTLWSMALSQTILAFYWMENSLNYYGCFRFLLRILYLGLVLAATIMSVQTTVGGLLTTVVVTVFVVSHPWTSHTAKRCLLAEIEIYDRLTTLEMSHKTNI